MNVLIVDDNSLHLKMCKILLEKLKHKVDTAESVNVLKKLLPTMQQPDVALVDFRLEPGITGVDILNMLKIENKWTKTKYIALTADVAEKSNLGGAGFDGIIFKPVTETLLAETLRAYE
ncbi:MAG: response regulator [Deferribacterales bacterium]